MSLRDAVSEIADQMETELSDMVADLKEKADGDAMLTSIVGGVGVFLRGFTRQLRTAVKAAPEDPSPAILSSVQGWAKEHGPDEHTQHLVEKAQARLREKKSILDREESQPIQRFLRGGPLDGTMVPIDPNMPVGANTGVGGSVYSLQANGELIYVPLP